VLRRRRGWIFGVAGGMLLAVALWTFLSVPVWRASTLVRVEEASSTDVPVLDVLSGLQRGGELETEMRIVRTRPILEQVVDDLDLNLVVESPRDVPRRLLFLRVDLGRDTPEMTFQLKRLGDGRWEIASTGEGEGALRAEFSPGDEVGIPGGSFVLADLETVEGPEGFEPPDEVRLKTLVFQDAVQELDETLEVTRPDREASLIQVAYEGTDRDLVARVPNAVAAAFIAQRREVQKTEVRSTVSFLQEQSDVLRTELDSAEAELRTFREGEQIVALGTEAEEQVKRLAELEAQRTQLDAERSALANLMADLDSGTGVPDYRRLAAFPTFFRNQAVGAMLEQLTLADARREQLRARMTPAHPDVIAVDREIEGLEAQLGSIGRNYLRSLNDQVASLDAVLARFGDELERIPEREIRFARLERKAQLIGELFTLLQTRLKEAEVAEAVEDAAVRVVEAAILPREPVRPRPARNLALAAVLGLMLGVGVAFVREYMDTRVHGSDDVEAMFGITPMGRIPVLPGLNGARGPETLVAIRDGHSVAAEAYRTLRTNVRYVRGGEGAREILVTSAGPQEGKSLTAANLAAAFAQQGFSTVVVDADMRRPVLHAQFGVERTPGLGDVLAGKATLEEAVVATEVNGLHLLPAGTHPPNPAELLGSDRMREVIHGLRERFECRVFDSPPTLAVTDAAVLGPRLEGVLLVVRAEKAERDAVTLAVTQLRHVGALVLGVVLNDAKSDGVYRYYRSYYGEEEPGRLAKLLGRS
jgi:tyrosine-protein kinase Etk/Wzc